MKHKYPRCPDCGGAVRPKQGAGRTRELLRGIHVPVPADFEIPTCVSCGEVSMAIEVSEPLDELLAKELAANIKRYVDAICSKHGITQQKLEDIIGVTRSYLSHLIGGRMPSAQLVKLLFLIAEVPGAFEKVAGPCKSLGMKQDGLVRD